VPVRVPNATGTRVHARSANTFVVAYLAAAGPPLVCGGRSKRLATDHTTG
jgi:hypothetical protein